MALNQVIRQGNLALARDQRGSSTLLGTFIQITAIEATPDIVTLIKRIAGEHLPVAVTGEIGHEADAWAVCIGTYVRPTR